MDQSLYERSLAVFPPVAARATNLGVIHTEGSYVYTEDGKKILDMASGVAVNNLGHRNPKIVEAIQKQMSTMIHVGHNVAYYESYVALGEKLVDLTGGDTMVYFSNSGAEANEGAIKLAKYVTGRPGILSFRNSFHGRTLACTTLTGSNAAYRKNYEPLLPSVYWADYANCYRCPFYQTQETCHQECISQFQDIFTKLIDPSMIAAMILEPVQGEGGYIVPPKAFLEEIRRICDRHGILLIFDEIQTGIGRTGTMFAYEQFGIQPDILTLAKALSGGVPLSAVIGKKAIMEQWAAGAHGGTFGGNPLACSAALATLQLIEEEHLLERAKELGAYALEQMRALQKEFPERIGQVRGLGLMLAMELVHENGMPNGELGNCVKKEALNRDLIILLCGSDHNIIRLIPPLTVSIEEINIAITTIRAILVENQND